MQTGKSEGRRAAWRRRALENCGPNPGRQARVAARNGRAAVDLPTSLPLNAPAANRHTHDRAAGPTQHVLVGLGSSLAGFSTYPPNMTLVRLALTESCRNLPRNPTCLIRNRRALLHLSRRGEGLPRT